MYLCKFCTREFNLVDTKPMILICGHTFCEACISKLLAESGEFECMNCVQKIFDKKGLILNSILCDKSSLSNSKLTQSLTDSQRRMPDLGNMTTQKRPFYIPEGISQTIQQHKQINPSNLIEDERPHMTPMKQDVGFRSNEISRCIGCGLLSAHEFCSEKCKINYKSRREMLTRSSLLVTPSQKAETVSRSYITPTKASLLAYNSVNKSVDFSPMIANLGIKSKVKPRKDSPIRGPNEVVFCKMSGCNNRAMCVGERVFDFCGTACEEKYRRTVEK